jgi:hypothetical protein
VISLRERFQNAAYALLPSAPPAKIVGRDKELEQLRGQIVAAVRGGKGLGIYVSGMSGVGKTISIAHVIYNTLNDDIEMSSFEVIRVTGTGINVTNTFKYFAESIGLWDSSRSFNEEKAKSACMKAFCPRFSRGRKYPHHIVFIDEIDKAPKSTVKDLYEACGKPNSRLILIGVANRVDYHEKLQLDENFVPKLIVFRALNSDDLKEIVVSRAQGLLSDTSMSFLALKCLQQGGDVRFLLDITSTVLDYAMSQYQQRRDEIFMDIIADHKVTMKALDKAGLGVSRVSKLIGELPGPARTLLVALLLDRVGKTPCMKFPEIVVAVQIYADEVAWPRPSREEARKALDCLVAYSLVRDSSSAGASNNKPFNEVLIFFLLN